MMDHYEEFGVPRSASAADIHHAYRRLMQLLHPDHCGDEAGRRLAELQTKRLNAILAVLTDPLERERYDRSLLLAGASRSSPSPGSLAHVKAWIGPAAAVAMAIALLFLLAGRWQPALPKPPAAAPPNRVTAAPAPARLVRRAARTETRWPPPGAIRANPGKPMEPDGNIAPAALPQEPPGPDPSAWITEPLASAVPALPDPPHPPPRETLAGDWLAPPQPPARVPGLYPPEFIELRMTEASGTLRGKYRARYYVADRAISPNVAFEFEGRTTETGGQLPWTGAGGSRGDVTLRLLTNGNLEVTWVVHDQGREPGLISGTATLVRRVD